MDDNPTQDPENGSGPALELVDTSEPVAPAQPTSDKTFRDFVIAEPICPALAAEGLTTAYPTPPRTANSVDPVLLPAAGRPPPRPPRGRQTILFSATMPGEIVTLARRHLSRPMHIRAEQHDAPQHVPSTQQHVFRAHQMDKLETLARVLQAEGRGLTIVFCRTKRTCDQVATTLTTKGFAAAAVHGDLGQGQRERAMRAFRSGKGDVLVATDVAARGLDVDDVTH